MRGKAHSDETKAQVMAALLAGQGVSETARQFDIPESSVRNFKNRIDAERLAEVSAKKEEHFDELLCSYLASNLKALKAQCEVASDPTYLKRQPASELATLHGVMADKAVRLLEAAERAAAAESADTGQ